MYDIIYSTTDFTSLAASASLTVGNLRRARVVATGYVWGKLGAGATTATAGTASEFLITPNEPYEFVTTSGQDTLALIQETAGAKATVSLVG